MTKRESDPKRIATSFCSLLTGNLGEIIHIVKIQGMQQLELCLAHVGLRKLLAKETLEVEFQEYQETAADCLLA